MAKYEINFLIDAHKGSFGNKEEVLNFALCACFYCKSKFLPDEILEWISEKDNRETAVCPRCNIDAVLTLKWPIKDEVFLEEMNSYWF